MVKVYVEGGGDSNELKTACRKGFATFFEQAGLKGRMPRMVACGGRQDAFDSFCMAIANGEEAFLLVDSEESVANTMQPKDVSGKNDLEKWQPWRYLAQRKGDTWAMPTRATDLQCHLIVQCMENWFLADKDALKRFFGQGFQESQLPTISSSIETIDKQTVYDSLAKATANCKTKTQYGKGAHSFKLLAEIDPSKVIQASPWAKRLLYALKNKMGA